MYMVTQESFTMSVLLIFPKALQRMDLRHICYMVCVKCNFSFFDSVICLLLLKRDVGNKTVLRFACSAQHH